MGEMTECVNKQTGIYQWERVALFTHHANQKQET